MLPKEVLKHIKKIQITSSKIVSEVFAGNYKSAYKGTGMEFEEVREYQPGDDVRSIDWNVTARTGKPFIKKFREEREMTVIFLVDLSASMFCGSGDKLKKDTAAEVCSLLAFSAIKNNDKAGMILFSDTIEKVVRPQKGPQHVLRLIRDVLYYEPKGKKGNLANALDYLNKINRRKSVVFILSDFYDEEAKKELAVTARKHDVTAICINDTWEKELPVFGVMEVEDPESGKKIIIDTEDKSLRDMFKEKTEQFRQRRKKYLRSLNIGQIELTEKSDYAQELVGYFNKRKKRGL